jgi:hypothetical protein
VLFCTVLPCSISPISCNHSTFVSCSIIVGIGIEGVKLYTDEEKQTTCLCYEREIIAQIIVCANTI